MKKILIVLLCLLFALPALGEEPVRIVLWHSAADVAEVHLQQYIADFNATIGKEHNIIAEAVYQGAYADATTKMNNIISAKQPKNLPDVMQLDATGKVNYLSSGFAYTADDAAAEDPAFDTSALLGAAMSNWQLGGVQLGLPFATSTTLLYYNKTVLDELGIPVPETLADIAAIGALNGITVYADLPNTPSLANWLGQLGSAVINNGNGNDGTASEVVCYANGALTAFLTEWEALYQSGALKNAAGSQDSFIAGKVVFFTASSSKLAAILEKIDGAFELGVTLFPKVTSSATNGSTASGSCLVMFDKGDEERRAAARLLVEYLVSAEVQADWAAATGYIPVHADALSEPVYQQLISDYPQYAVSYRQLLETPSAMRSVTVGPSKDFYYTIQDAVSDMLDFDLDPADVALDLADSLNSLLYQYLRANPGVY